ncbi:hypothetical protein BKG59_05820 [Mycobacteroides chelonae]|nr:hypothetical protein BKG63_24315 [Mycobacteroides chelonae]OHU00548.1 hypothetical protein BKG72_03985 [Mycobacteroides chelonae]OLT92960.1 hypothetical protein BKG59_05820 [Mycobacteroides chelonae]
MQDAPEHWSERASCRGDGRFTLPKEWLEPEELKEMQHICLGCDVFDQCFQWAEWGFVDHGFAAGEWWVREWPESDSDQ